MTSAPLRRSVLGFTALLLLVLGLVAAPAAQASTGPDVDQARQDYFAAAAADDEARAQLITAIAALRTARDNVASAQSTLANANAAYRADPNPSTADARYVASYQLSDAKMQLSQARLDLSSAVATHDGTHAARLSALDAYRAARAG